MPKDKDQDTEKEPKEPTLDEALNELPIPEKYKGLVKSVFTGIANQLIETNKALAEVKAELAEVKKGPAIPQSAYDKMSADQIHEIEMAKAQATAQASQHQLLQSMIHRDSGGGFGDLLKSADSINALRNILVPPPTPLQAAMEKAQVAQLLAQTRVMNKIVGKQTDTFLDSIEAGLGGAEGE